MDERSRKAFYDKLHEMTITIPFVEDLRLIPSCTKYMKDFLNNNPIREIEQVCLTEAS